MKSVKLPVSMANDKDLFVSSQNQKLHIENRLLQEKTNGLLAENEELRQRLSLDTIDSKDEVGAVRGATRVGRRRSGELKSLIPDPGSVSVVHREGSRFGGRVF